MHWYVDVLKNYTKFHGRARRSEYWMYTLFNGIIALILSGIDNLIGTYPVLYAIYMLGVLLPGLAVFVRRLHDIGRSGAWFFISFIPIVGGIVLLIFVCQDSQPGVNQYGANPKGELI